MASFTSQEPSNWRSLFLPTTGEEEVAFAIFDSISSSSPAHNEHLQLPPSGALDDVYRPPNGLVVVLRNGDIIFFSLQHSSGPHRMHTVVTSHLCSAGTPTTASSASLVAPHVAAKIGAEMSVVIGSSDGRVSVCSRSTKLFSFAAHHCAIRMATLLANEEEVSASASADSQAGGGGRPILGRIRMVTCGVDMQVTVWAPARDGLTLHPHHIWREKSFFSRGFSIALNVPPIGPPLIARGTSSTLTLMSVLSSSTTRHLYPLPPPPTVTFTNLFTTGGGCTAVGCNEEFALIAVGRQVYRVELGGMGEEEYREPPCILTAPNSIQHISISCSIAALGSERTGRVLLVSPSVPQAITFGTYFTYQHRPLRSLSLCTEASLFVLVDAQGTAEVVSLLTMWDHVAAGSGSLAAQMPSVQLLQSRIALESAIQKDREARRQHRLAAGGEVAQKKMKNPYRAAAARATGSNSSIAMGGASRLLSQVHHQSSTAQNSLLQGMSGPRCFAQCQQQQPASASCGYAEPSPASTASLRSSRETLLLARLLQPALPSSSPRARESTRLDACQ